MKHTITLKIRVSDKVVMREGTASSAVNTPIPSPFFKPEFSFKVKKEVDWSTTKPRGPTVVIDMEYPMAAF